MRTTEMTLPRRFAPLGLALARASMGLVQESVATLYAEVPPTRPDVSWLVVGMVVAGSVLFACVAAMRPAQNAAPRLDMKQIFGRCDLSCEFLSHLEAYFYTA